MIEINAAARLKAAASDLKNAAKAAGYVIDQSNSSSRGINYTIVVYKPSAKLKRSNPEATGFEVHYNREVRPSEYSFVANGKTRKSGDKEDMVKFFNWFL